MTSHRALYRLGDGDGSVGVTDSGSNRRSRHEERRDQRNHDTPATTPTAVVAITSTANWTDPMPDGESPVSPEALTGNASVVSTGASVEDVDDVVVSIGCSSSQMEGSPVGSGGTVSTGAPDAAVSFVVPGSAGAPVDAQVLASHVTSP